MTSPRLLANLSIAGNSTVTGNSTISGNAIITGTASITGTTTVGNGVFQSGVSLSGNLMPNASFEYGLGNAISTNPSFENGTTNWSAGPLGSISATSTGAEPDGTGALVVTPDNSFGPWLGFAQHDGVQLDADAYYTLSYYLRGATTSIDNLNAYLTNTNASCDSGYIEMYNFDTQSWDCVNEMDFDVYSATSSYMANTTAAGTAYERKTNINFVVTSSESNSIVVNFLDFDTNGADVIIDAVKIERGSLTTDFDDGSEAWWTNGMGVNGAVATASDGDYALQMDTIFFDPYFVDAIGHTLTSVSADTDYDS